ncbi:hypothetical protein LIER_20682 [Lithospermum erythrorhizon]|uniref:Pectate lyase n=1 Tax=Lithospermum erythrorhizon TaxID=34254 RepID=A0AAV3QME1_LITER
MDFGASFHITANRNIMLNGTAGDYNIIHVVDGEPLNIVDHLWRHNWKLASGASTIAQGHKSCCYNQEDENWINQLSVWANAALGGKFALPGDGRVDTRIHRPNCGQYYGPAKGAAPPLNGGDFRSVIIRPGGTYTHTSPVRTNKEPLTGHHGRPRDPVPDAEVPYQTMDAVALLQKQIEALTEKVTGQMRRQLIRNWQV